MRYQLESDIVGLKAWVRTMERTEREHVALLRELAQVQDDRDARGADAAQCRTRCGAGQGGCGRGKWGVVSVAREDLRVVGWDGSWLEWGCVRGLL